MFDNRKENIRLRAEGRGMVLVVSFDWVAVEKEIDHKMSLEP